MKEVSADDVAGLPGTSITLIPTSSIEYAERLLNMKKAWKTERGKK